MTIQLDWLRGCATALVTPFTSSGAVDERCLRDLIDHQINGGVRLLVPCGTTGESVTMTDEENRLVIGTTVDVARGRAKVIAGTGSNSTAVTIARSFSDTFAGIRPVDAPGFIAAQFAGAIAATIVIGWLTPRDKTENQNER